MVSILIKYLDTSFIPIYVQGAAGITPLLVKAIKRNQVTWDIFIILEHKHTRGKFSEYAV